MSNLWQQLEEISSLPHGWTSFEKAKAMASAVIALRPAVSVELGVYAAKGLTSLALAHKEIGFGEAIGIDPYSAAASVEGQVDEKDRDWWANAVNYDQMHQTAISTLAAYSASDYARIIIAKSRDADVPENIGVIRIDGNHGEEVIRDVQRYTPNCVPGAILFLDDLEWPGMSVKRAAEILETTGWRKLYNIDDGAAYQKIT